LPEKEFDGPQLTSDPMPTTVMMPSAVIAFRRLFKKAPMRCRPKGFIGFSPETKRVL
jgi:hypothetical protein